MRSRSSRITANFFRFAQDGVAPPRLAAEPIGHSNRRAHAHFIDFGLAHFVAGCPGTKLEDQRSEIERYAAANGYHIVRWYQDDGISGDATERRDGFLAFHKAACHGRDFDVVIVWDQDRFGRFDSMEAGYWIHPLRKAGVRLVSVNEGLINWDDFTGRVMYSLKQEGKHPLLRDLSRNVSRG